MRRHPRQNAKRAVRLRLVRLSKTYLKTRVLISGLRKRALEQAEPNPASPRWNPWFFAGLMCAVLMASLIHGCVSGLAPPEGEQAEEDPAPTREQIWAEVRTNAREHELDPYFVYGIIYAESSFRRTADSGKARGLMQMSEIAWAEVMDEPYENVWDWRRNIAGGTAYLAFCREVLLERDEFTYPLVAACYLHGPNAVKAVGHDISKLPPTGNLAYQKILRGELPIQPPAEAE